MCAAARRRWRSFCGNNIEPLMKKICRAISIVLAAVSAAVAGAEPVAWHPATAPLMTRWAVEVNPTNALPEYPRPQLVRAGWKNLNGLWDCAITPDSEIKPPAFAAQILVPFPVESAL